MSLICPTSDFWEIFIAFTVSPHFMGIVIYIFPFTCKYVSIPLGGYWYQTETCGRKGKVVDVFKNKKEIVLINIFILNLWTDI